MTRQITDRRWLTAIIPGILLTLVGTVPAGAQDAAQPVAEPAAEPAVDPAAEPAADVDKTVELQSDAVITPEAQAVLDRMQATFKGMKRYSVTADITRDEVLPFGYKLQNNESARMWVDAPTGLRLEVDGDIKTRTYVYDGKQLTMFAPDHNVYAATEAPPTLGELVRDLLDDGVEMPLIDLLYEGNTGSLTDDVRVGIVVGESEVDGVATDHLAFRQPTVDWQLWVDKGAQALPRKLLITTRYAVGDPQYQAILHWDLKPRIDAKSFVFVPPADATKIPYSTDLFARGGDK